MSLKAYLKGKTNDFCRNRSGVTVSYYKNEDDLLAAVVWSIIMAGLFLIVARLM
jgi:hypothetical protein